jgi:hypothetical protein
MQLAITKTIIILTIHCYITLPILITTTIPTIVVRYKGTISLYYRVSIDSNSLIVRKISIETTSRTNRLQTTFLAI